MTRLIANARMYAVTPEAEEAWRDAARHGHRAAGLDFDYLPYPAPQPLEACGGGPISAACSCAASRSR